MKRFKTGIRLKITIGIFLIGIILGTAGLGLGYFLGFRLLRNTIGKNSVEMSSILAMYVGTSITEEINDIKIYVERPLYKTAVQESNAGYAGMTEKDIKKYFLAMDEKWANLAETDEFFKGYLKTELAEALSSLVAIDPYIIEIFYTDRYGGIVVSSGKTSDFYQADEKWWQAAFNKGRGGVYLSDIIFDDSAGYWFVSISAPIRGRDGSTIGVCKLVLNAERFFGYLNAFSLGGKGQAFLLDEKGLILSYNRGATPLGGHFLSKASLKRLHENPRRWAITQNGEQKKGKIFVAFSRVQNLLLEKLGKEWVVYIAQDEAGVFKPLNILFLQMFFVISFLLVSIILLGIIFGNLFVRPIKKLNDGIGRIGAGDLDHRVGIKTGDEIEQLADSFNKMAGNLKNTTASVYELNREITGRKKTEMELRRTQEATLNILEDLREAKTGLEEALKIKSEFTSVVSHELRTPLTAIKEGIAIVMDGTAGKINAEQKDFLDTAKRNVDRLTRLINDVLDFQKLEAGKVKFKMEENDINEIIMEVKKEMTPAAKEKNLDFSTKLDKKIPKIEFDRDAIIQVLTNLINNAVKFTEKGGITVITGCDQKCNTVSVSVKDTGIGIKKEDLQHLFHKFEQLEKGKSRKTGGTGLGLAISKEIIEKHKGKIWAESEPGKGTTFHFVLPLKGGTLKYGEESIDS